MALARLLFIYAGIVILVIVNHRCIEPAVISVDSKVLPAILARRASKLSQNQRLQVGHQQLA